jgi:hypothetical protein
MSIIYRVPTNVSMDETTQEYTIQREKMLGEEVLPFAEAQTQRVEWDELDVERGMTAPSNLKTDPKVDTRPGSKLRSYKPIPFKETDVVGEDELLEARAYGTLGGVVNLSEIVGRIMRARMDKTYVRAEWLRWETLQGGFTVDENGVYVHETFPIQTYDSLVDWDSRATATPLRDDNAVSLLFDGTGASADGAIAYCNQKTLNWRLENANPDDLGGKRVSATDINISLKRMNEVAVERGLPIYKLYNEGYNPRAGDFTKFIHDGNVVVVGKRQTGQKVGDFLMTPSFHRIKNGQPAPGFFNILEINGRGNPGMVEVSAADLGAGKNPRIENTGGVYGGTRLKYPRSVVLMRVKH